MNRFAWLLALAACHAPASTAPPDGPLTVRVRDYPSADSALRVVEVRGGTLDFQGIAPSGPLVIRSSPLLIHQVRGVRITNCLLGWSGVPVGTPLLQLAPGVSGYFLEIDHCLMNGQLRFDRFFNSTFHDLWFPGNRFDGYGNPEPGLLGVGPAYYNMFRQLYAGGLCLDAEPDQQGLGPNTNQIDGFRCQGTIRIGSGVQDWIIRASALEGCGTVCLQIAGVQVSLEAGNRFECNAPVGIALLPGSSGRIEPQDWEGGCAAKIAWQGADPKGWRIADQ